MGGVTPQWLAGFFDGEGTVDIRLRRTHGGKYMRFELRCQIVQRDPLPLLLIAEAYGGSIQKAKTSSCSAWVVGAKAAEAFLRAIAPHSVCKSAQIAVALRFSETIKLSRTTLTADEVRNRLALMRELRGIRDDAGLTPKGRNDSLQAAAAILAISRQQEALEDRGRAPSSGEDRGLH